VSIPDSWKRDGKLFMAGEPGKELVVLMVPCPHTPKNGIRGYLPASVCVETHRSGKYAPCENCRLGIERGAPLWQSEKGRRVSGPQRNGGGRPPSGAEPIKPNPVLVQFKNNQFRGAWLQSVMDKHGVTLAEFARRIGVDRYQVSLWRRDAARMHTSSVARVLKVFPEATTAEVQDRPPGGHT
jgi:hypothetical protein